MPMINNDLFPSRLWNRNFCKLCITNVLLVVSVYMLIPVIAESACDIMNIGHAGSSLFICVFGIGLFFLGGLCSFLIQRFRRNKVCVYAILLLSIMIMAIMYMYKELADFFSIGQLFSIFVFLRFLMGAFYGLAYMVLNGVLLVDCCQSVQRTSANIYSGCFHKFSIILGLILGIYMYGRYGITNTLYLSSVVCLCSAVLLSSVKFPFKAPEETVRLISSDRFFSLNYRKISIPVVLLFFGTGFFLFFSFAMKNLAIALLGAIIAFVFKRNVKHVFRPNGIISLGYLLVLLSSILCLGDKSAMLFSCLFCGMGFSLLSEKYNLFYINVGDHCQRGTSQNTYLLSVEFGLALGLSVALMMPCCLKYIVSIVSGSCFVASYLIYSYITKKWLLTNLRK